MDSQRVLAWLKDPKRKPANTAFTEGEERQAAYLIEEAERPLREAGPRLLMGKAYTELHKEAVKIAKETLERYEQ